MPWLTAALTDQNEQRLLIDKMCFKLINQLLCCLLCYKVIKSHGALELIMLK